MKEHKMVFFWVTSVSIGDDDESSKLIQGSQLEKFFVVTSVGRRTQVFFHDFQLIVPYVRTG